MSTVNRKIVSGVLTATTSVWMSGVLMLIPVAHGQTTADLQALIAGLQVQIQQLQAQLNATQGGGSMTTTTFTRNLTVGATGEDVKALQEFLNSHGFTVSQSGAGSPGSESTYFGTKTKAALAQYQASQGISPAVGYFGPITRGAINSVMAVTPPTPGPTPTPTPTPGTPPPVAGTGLSASLASANPTAGSIISGAASAARVPVLAVALTAGTGSAINVSTLKFKKVGVLADSAISNAYLVESGKVIAQYSSISGGVITFDGLVWSVSAGQTRTLTLAIDPAANLSAGNTVSFALDSAASVVSTDASNNAVTASGAFPLNGNVFTVTSVSNPAIGAVTFTSSTVGNTVYAGTTGVLVSQWTVGAQTNPQWLNSINFKVTGSATKTDLKNVKLLINGVQAGPTLASVAADGSAYFDLTGAPVKLNAGNSNMQVYADVMGSPSFTFQFQLLNTYDVYAVDSQYNTPVGVTITGGAGQLVTIQQGTINVSLASDTPTGNISSGGSQVPLLKATFYAAGEPVKVKWLTFSLAFAGINQQTLDGSIKNVTLADDAGNPVGSTINSLITTVTCTDGAGFTAVTSTARNCFGSSGSQINYTIPANTTRVLTLRGDVQSGAEFTTVQAALLASTASNLQGLTSSQLANSGAVTGSVLTRSSSSITVAKNSAVGTPTVAAGAIGTRIGSYTLTANAAEGANLTSLSILMSGNAALFQNLKVMSGTTQIGNTLSVLLASSTNSVSGALNIPAGQTKTLDIIADVLSGSAAGTYSVLTTLSNCSGSGATTFTSVTCSSTAGQNVIIAGQAAITVAIDTATPSAGQIVMGSPNVELARFRFEATNVEDVKIDNLNIFQQVAATNTVKSAFSGLSLYKIPELTLLATAGSALTAASTSNPGPGYYYKFNFGSNPIIVPQGNSVSVVLKAGVSSYSATGATDNTTHVFKIASSTDSDNDAFAGETVNALGKTSNATSAVTRASGSSAPNGNALTILRSKLTVSAAALGGASHTKSATDDLGTITFAADAAGTVVLNTITVTFGGTAPSNDAFLGPTATTGVVLLEDGVNVVTSLSATTATGTRCSSTQTTCTKSWNFGTTNAGTQISQGTSRTFKLRADTTNTLAGASGVSQTLSAIISAATDVVFTDGTTAQDASPINLETKVVPVTINSVSFPAGS